MPQPVRIALNNRLILMAQLNVNGISSKNAGLTIALVHLLFNCIGILVFYPFPPLRRIPLRLAEGLGNLAVKNRAYVLAYIGVVFVVLPLVGILIFRG